MQVSISETLYCRTKPLYPWAKYWMDYFSIRQHLVSYPLFWHFFLSCCPVELLQICVILSFLFPQMSNLKAQRSHTLVHLFRTCNTVNRRTSFPPAGVDLADFAHAADNKLNTNGRPQQGMQVLRGGGPSLQTIGQRKMRHVG